MRKKLFIIDGPDGAGKTTLAEKLSDIYNIPIYHLTYYKDKVEHQRQFDRATRMIIEWCKSPDEGFILDRYILSELAYQAVYRPDEPLIEDAQNMLEVMEHRATLGDIEIIIALPEDKERWLEHFKKLEESREEMYSSEKISQVYDEYYKHWKKMRYNRNVTRYDLFENMKGENKKVIKNI